MPLSDAWVDFLAGWCSGAAAVLACQPVDTVLTRWQAGPSLVTATSTTTAATNTTATTTTAAPATSSSSYNVVRNMARSLTQTSGYTALWRGSSPMIGAVPIQNALLMGGYGLGLQYAEHKNNNINNTDNSDSHHHHHRYMAIFVGGCTGGILQSFFMSPVELVKVSQQCAGQSLTTASKDLAFNLTHAAQMKVAWTGLGATLLRDGIPHGVWFVSYEACKNYMTASSLLLDEDSVVVPLVSGAVAATTAWAVGYPADLIKTRLQASAAVMATTSGSSSLGILGTARQLVEEANGRVIRGLYRGFGLKLVRSVPASMIGFTTYELVKKQVLESL